MINEEMWEMDTRLSESDGSEESRKNFLRMMGYGTSSVAKHLVKHCGGMKTQSEVRRWCLRNVEVKILASGKQILLCKTAGTDFCRLCMEERVQISTRWRSNKFKLVNCCSEIYGSCSCKTRFHRLKLREGGTDEELSSETLPRVRVRDGRRVRWKRRLEQVFPID